MNSFYKQPLWLQWFEAILLVLIGLYPAVAIFELMYSNPLFYLLFLLYIPIGQFTTTPIFKLLGVYTYYSPMLLGYMANKVHIDLHSGGSFDYLFVMRKFKRGGDTRNRLLLYYLDGLLHIITQIENGIIPKTVIISGTSYFFSETTVNRLGFQYEKPSLWYRINLLANFIDLSWMYSLSQGQISIPTVWKAKKASIVGGRLVDYKEIVTELHRKLANRLMNNERITSVFQNSGFRSSVRMRS